jgi:hypothetical protein
MNNTTNGNDFPRLNINTEELRTEVEMLLAAAAEDKEHMGAVNWGDLGVMDIEYRLSMLRPQDGPHCMVIIEEADPGCRLPMFLYENWDRAKYPGVYFECEW